MYLHYYLNQKYVGVVDIEVFMDSKHSKTLITCGEDCENLLLGLELVYGKHIERFGTEDAWALQHGHHYQRGQQKAMRMSPHVYTTKKCGKVLQWDERNRTLLCG